MAEYSWILHLVIEFKFQFVSWSKKIYTIEWTLSFPKCPRSPNLVHSFQEYACFCWQFRLKVQYARVTGGKNSAFCETGQQKEVYFGTVWTVFGNLLHFGKLRVHTITGKFSNKNLITFSQFDGRLSKHNFLSYFASFMSPLLKFCQTFNSWRKNLELISSYRLLNLDNLRVFKLLKIIFYIIDIAFGNLRF